VGKLVVDRLTLIGAGSVNLVSAVSLTGDVKVRQGESYLLGENALAFVDTLDQWDDLVAGPGETIAVVAETPGAVQFPCTIIHATAAPHREVQIPLTSAQTSSLRRVVRAEGRFSIVARWTSGGAIVRERLLANGIWETATEEDA
jgi:hypothetical protein